VFGHIGNKIVRTRVGQLELGVTRIDQLVMVAKVNVDASGTTMKKTTARID
jgi:hypothetical protein